MTLTDNMIFTMAFLALMFPLGCYLVNRSDTRRAEQSGGAPMATRNQPPRRGATLVVNLESRRRVHPDPKDWPPEAA